MSEDLNIVLGVVVLITYVWHVIPSMQNINLVIKTYLFGIYPNSLHDHDIPYAVCHVAKRASQMMIPGHNVCLAGWTCEFKGYLMAEMLDHHRTMYTCVDENPNYTRGTHANLNGALLYFFWRSVYVQYSLHSLNMNSSLSSAMIEHQLLSHLYSFAPLCNLSEIICLIFWHSDNFMSYFK
jgi:N-acetylated-alpha-linked acidic dipeptidase